MAGPATYTWAVGEWRGFQPDWQLVSVTNRALHIALNDISTAGFTVNGDHADGGHITDLISDLYVARNGVDLFRGRVTNTVDDIQETSYALGVTASDYFALLDRSVLLGDSTPDSATLDASGNVVYTAVEQADIVASLLSYAQTKVNGDIGVRQAAGWPTTGITRTVSFTPGTSVWAALKQLISLSDGFDLNIDPTLTMNLLYPPAGGYHGTTLAYPGNLLRAQGTTSQSTYFDVVYQTGGALAGSSTVPAPATVTADDIDTRDEGRWEATISTPELTTDESVSDAANYYFQRYGERLQTSWQLTLTPGAWLGPSMLWVGDVIDLSVHRGRRWVDIQSRVYALDIALDQNDIETVTFTVGTVVLDDRSVIEKLARKLNYLAKQ